MELVNKIQIYISDGDMYKLEIDIRITRNIENYFCVEKSLNDIIDSFNENNFRTAFYHYESLYLTDHGDCNCLFCQNPLHFTMNKRSLSNDFELLKNSDFDRDLILSALETIQKELSIFEDINCGFVMK